MEHGRFNIRNAYTVGAMNDQLSNSSAISMQDERAMKRIDIMRTKTILITSIAAMVAVGVGAAPASAAGPYYGGGYHDGYDRGGYDRSRWEQEGWRGADQREYRHLAYEDWAHRVHWRAVQESRYDRYYGGYADRGGW